MRFRKVPQTCDEASGVPGVSMATSKRAGTGPWILEGIPISGGQVSGHFQCLGAGRLGAKSGSWRTLRVLFTVAA